MSGVAKPRMRRRRRFKDRHEIRRFVEEGYREATRILTEKRADSRLWQGPARIPDAERR